MSSRADDRDRELLAAAQSGVAPMNRPFKEIADRLGWDEAEVITRLQKLSDSGHIRKFGAVLAPKKMGYVSLLAAIEVPDDRIEHAAEVINAFPGVTHNYIRDTIPNVWFTMTEVDEPTLDSNLRKIEEQLGSSVIRLPMTRLFKIGVKLDI
jgi:siroheme decarboxylase